MSGELTQVAIEESPDKNVILMPGMLDQTLNDIGNSERLVKRYGRHIRYCHGLKAWFVWNGKVWDWDKQGKINMLAKEVSRFIYKEAAECKSDVNADKLVKFAKTSCNQGKIKAMIELAQSIESIQVHETELDNKQYMFNADNKTIDLRSGKSKDFAKEDYMTKVISTSYNPNAKCPRWLQFIDEITCGNKEMAHFMQKAIGYSITGNVKEQALFIMYGNGSNGKSVFLDTLGALMGEYCKVADSRTLMQRTNDQTDDLAALKGARLVCVSETEEGQSLSESMVKKLTGGERITCRHLYGNWFEYEPTFKIWMACNHLPKIKGQDEGIWRRLRVLRFERQFTDEEKDYDLSAKLRAELPGILNWAVEGCLMWQKEKLGLPNCVRVATTEYRTDSDVLADFFEECCELGAGKRVTNALLYNAYEAWCRENYVRGVLAKKTFVHKLKERGFEPYRTTAAKGLIGITVNSDIERHLLIERSPFSS